MLTKVGRSKLFCRFARGRAAFVCIFPTNKNATTCECACCVEVIPSGALARQKCGRGRDIAQQNVRSGWRNFAGLRAEHIFALIFWFFCIKAKERKTNKCVHQKMP